MAQGSHTIGINYTPLSTEVNYVATPGAANTVTPNSFTVAATATTVAVTSSQTSPMLYGTPVTFTATVSTGVTGGTLAGTVQFYDNAVALGAAVALGGTSAALNFPPSAALLPALHPITAIFTSTNSSFSSSPTSPAFNMTVNQATTTTTVSAGQRHDAGLGPVHHLYGIGAGNPVRRREPLGFRNDHR